VGSGTWLYRHDELSISRPYAFDVDEDDWLWEGTSRNRLMGHNLRTAEFRLVRIPEMAGEVVYSVFAWHGKLVLEFGHAHYYLVCDVRTGEAVRKALPGDNPITWYGTKLPGDKLMLADRGQGRAVILDAPDADPRIIPCPYEGDFSGGTVLSDGLLYTFLGDPARLVRFDPAAERFVDERPLSWPEAGISGRFEHDGVLYAADSSGGRLLRLDMKAQQWLDPIPHPDHGKVFGFIGGAFGLGSKGYFCLSSYAHRSRLDTKTGKIIIPDGPLSVDGRPPRFLERMLVFDAEAGTFDYLTAPEQPDGVPLLCYSWTDGERFAVTGVVVHWDEPGVPGPVFGPWIVLQNREAREHPFGTFDTGFDMAAFLRRQRRAYPADHCLYLDEEPHCPTIVNMHGPATQYGPGKSAELERRAKRTDAPRYWRDVAEQVCAGQADDADKVNAILAHVHHRFYYNPIQEPITGNPIAVHEAREGRCGQVATILLELFAAAGVEARKVPLAHHVTCEAFYDGLWHYTDPLFFGTQQPARDGRVLSAEELKADPYFSDGWPQVSLAYEPELLLSEDGFHVLGYVFGPWGSMSYYSYYLHAPEERPPTLPFMLPARRAGERAVDLMWSPSVKFQGGAIEYDVRVFTDRACAEEIFHAATPEISVRFEVPEANRMYFVEVRAMDDHREKNPDTWYPAARYNFVFVPEEQYGWYGVL